MENVAQKLNRKLAALLTRYEVSAETCARVAALTNGKQVYVSELNSTLEMERNIVFRRGPDGQDWGNTDDGFPR